MADDEKKCADCTCTCPDVVRERGGHHARCPNYRIRECLGCSANLDAMPEGGQIYWTGSGGRCAPCWSEFEAKGVEGLGRPWLWTDQYVMQPLLPGATESQDHAALTDRMARDYPLRLADAQDIVLRTLRWLRKGEGADGADLSAVAKGHAELVSGIYARYPLSGAETASCVARALAWASEASTETISSNDLLCDIWDEIPFGTKEALPAELVDRWRKRLHAILGKRPHGS